MAVAEAAAQRCWGGVGRRKAGAAPLGGGGEAEGGGGTGRAALVRGGVLEALEEHFLAATTVTAGAALAGQVGERTRASVDALLNFLLIDPSAQTDDHVLLPCPFRSRMKLKTTFNFLLVISSHGSRCQAMLRPQNREVA